MSLPIVGAVLGHADPKTTQRYLHIDTESLAQDGRLLLSFEVGDGPKSSRLERSLPQQRPTPATLVTATARRSAKKRISRHYERSLVIPGGLEPPTYGLGNRRSIHLSYGTRARQDCPSCASNANPAEGLRGATMRKTRFSIDGCSAGKARAPPLF